MKAIIIDDEKFCREDLFEKINIFFPSEITVIGQADSVKTAVPLIKNLKPDLLLLDINLEDGNGFDVIANCNNKNFDVIFITGYDQHALKAIKVGALDYVLKPIDDDEFKIAINKALKSSNKNEELDKHLEVSREYFNGTEKKRIILKTLETVYAVFEDDILYCKSEGNYTTYYTINGERILISKPLKNAEDILTEANFVRCHQSYIVNKKHVVKYHNSGVLIINHEIKIPVSSRRKDYSLTRIFG